MEKSLSEVYRQRLDALGIEEFNAMQEELVREARDHGNVMLLAPTGSGKTLAFLTAILERMDTTTGDVQAVVLAPSRELAIQIEQVFRTMRTELKVSCCYGGHDIKIEINSLREAPALVIATPGRLADHISRGTVDVSRVRVVVLDEFDKSLQLGFHDQIQILFKALSGRQRHVLTSATRMDDLPEFLPFRQPALVDFLVDDINPRLQLKVVHTGSANKAETLMKLVASFGSDVCLVFCNHREAVDRISALFTYNDFEHGILHGAMEQIDREKNLIKFRGGAFTVLIATDLAARGLDIPEIRHVIHYQLPHREDAFIHRNGRTARMHADGQAYLVLADDEVLPEYIGRDVEPLVLPDEVPLPPPPAYACLYISAGRKDKVNKGDIAGLLMKKGGVTADDVGLITTLDHASFVSVKRPLVKKLLANLKDERIKKLKVKIAVAN